MNKWTKKNAVWMLVYAVLYAVFTALICVTGMIHPVMFVCYQVTAGILLSGLVITAFRRVQAFGAALVLGAGMLLLLLVIQDAVAWHVIPVVIIAVLAEAVRALGKYSFPADAAATVLMSFSSFGYYGQIWFNRAYTYECALEEMPEGYGDALMSVSPAWSLPVVILAGICLSVLVSRLTGKLFHLEER